jgi:RNA polymerase sigma-70 factor (ECF subfamily)
MDETRQSLLESLRRRDEAAWRLAFSEYLPLIRRQILQYLENPSDLEEITQEVYLAAHQGIDSFERQGPGSFRRWLRNIARNKAVSRLRKKNPRTADDTHAQELLSTLAEPHSEALDQEDQESLAYWRDRIDAKARLRHSGEVFECFDAVKRRGESVREVAIRLGLPEARIHGNCSRVLRTLQELMAEFGELMEM